MKYRRLGKSGIKVSEISLGSWLTYGKSVDNDLAYQCVKTAIDNGINLIDTADIYNYGQSEIVLGEILKNFKRSDIVLATKTFFPMSQNINDRGLSRKHIIESCNKSLKRLQTDYIDLYQCHRFDYEIEIEELISTMDDLVKMGKILYWGVSEWSALQICDTVHTAKYLNKTKPSSNQPVYNMLNRYIEDEIIPLCKRDGLGLIVFSPLAEGILTGKYNNGIPQDSRANKNNINMFIKNKLTEENINKVRKLTNIANELGVTMSQLALSWCLRKEEITSTIIGASNPNQILENIKAVDIELDNSVLNTIEDILEE
ncbi:MAG: voltage-gated potassium channel [Candidatus Sericytochromatia bacterium]|nr:MAG: voltage-gated potassium channel [Candidatus Sericytochromatia bacterium]